MAECDYTYNTAVSATGQWCAFKVLQSQRFYACFHAVQDAYQDFSDEGHETSQGQSQVSGMLLGPCTCYLDLMSYNLHVATDGPQTCPALGITDTVHAMHLLPACKWRKVAQAPRARAPLPSQRAWRDGRCHLLRSHWFCKGHSAAAHFLPHAGLPCIP